MTSFSRLISAPLASKLNQSSSKAKWLAVAMIALGGVEAEAQTAVTFTTAGNQTWTCPTGITTVQVEAYGAGGGSGGAGAHFASTGGAAGGSYVKVTTLTVTPGTVYNLTVGAGGTAGTGGGGGTNNGGAGGTGGSSYFGNTTAGSSTGASILAVGGPGSVGNNTAGVSTTNRTQTAAGIGTNSGNLPSNATVNTAGSSGTMGLTTTNSSGAGGAGAGPLGGSGGVALTSAGNANPGNAPGGGAGGADQSSSSNNGAGAAGGTGEIVLTLPTVTPMITISGTPTPVSTPAGTASTPTTFSAAGTNLTANITVTAPTGFQVSTSVGSGYSSSISLTETGGTVASTPVYVRLASTTPAGAYSGNVGLSSTGAASVNQAIPSSTVVTSFTQGNLAVEQLAANATSSTFAVIELSPSTASQSAPVNTYYVPATVTSSSLRQSSAGSTGRLATSNDGTLLAFTGFEDTTARAPTYDETTITQRGAASLSQGFQYALQASYTDSASSGDQTRGATFNSSTWYMSDKNGIWLNGTTTSANNTNIRPIKSFGGTVYAMSANASAVVSTVSTDGTTLTGLPGLTAADGNAVDFYMLSSGVNGSTFDIFYVCDGANVTKYSLVSGTWVLNGSATAMGVTGDGFCAAGNGTGVYLYTSTGATNTVVRVTDTAGYNQAPSINTANNVTLYTAASGYLKGVAFAPVATALPDLTIGVSAPANVAGSSFDYTVTLANSGAASASGVNAQFTLPTGLTYVSGTDNGSAGFTVTNNNGVVSMNGGTLAAGASETITVSVTGTLGSSYTVDAGTSASIVGDGFGVINTSATTTTPIAESNASNNCSNISVSTLLANSPILTVNIAGPGTAAANSNFSYTLTAKNNGLATASGAATIQFTLPAGVSYVSGADNGTDGFTAAYSNGVVTFSGGTMAQGAIESLTVTVNAATSTYRISTVTVPSGAVTITPNGGSSTSVVSTSITLPSGPDLTVASTPNGAFVPGSNSTFTVYANNMGTSAESSSVTVTETLPTGLTYVSASGTGWSVSVNGQTITATYTGTIQPGMGSNALTITVAVASGASGTVTNNLTVGSSDDAFTQNGSGSNSITLGSQTPLIAPGYLLVTRGHYTGTASTITVGQTLPNGSAATASGQYPSLWTNETPDASFGITAPIYVDVISPGLTSPVMSTSVSGSTNVTSLIKSQLGMDVTTSFSSKSELGANPIPDGTGVTMMGYVAPALTLDVSNANVPYHDDPTSPLASHGDFQHAVIQMDYLGNVKVTPIDAYSGDNSRNAILAKASDGNSYYYSAGSAGNSGAGVTGTIMSMLANCTGIQMILPGAGGLTSAVGKPYGTSGSTTGYQLGYAGLPGDKTGKDMNLRGLALNPFSNTLYASKGSGGSGVDTVYQIGSGVLTPTTATTATFTIPSGFPTTTDGQHYPFGMWFASPSVMYVADEGEVPPSPVTYDSGNGSYDEALPLNNPLAGLQKWVNSQPDGSGTWTLAYTLQSGLNLGVPYSYAIGNTYPAIGTVNPANNVPWQPANNGLRNLAGQLNGDGTATIYAVTSTVSGETDIGADPNQLVTITDNVAATSLPVSESFTVLEEAGGLDVLRGVSLFQGAPVNPVMATNVTSSGATLNGVVNPNGTDAQVYFQYGTSTSYGSSTTEQDMGSGTSPVSFSTTLGGLLPTMVYYYREVTVINGVTTYYAGQSFTTPAGSGGTISNEVDTPTMPPAALVILAIALMGYAFHSTRRREA